MGTGATLILIPVFAFGMQLYIEKIAGFSSPSSNDVDRVAKKHGAIVATFVRAIPVLRVALPAIMALAGICFALLESPVLKVIAATLIAAVFIALSIVVNWRLVWKA